MQIVLTLGEVHLTISVPVIVAIFVLRQFLKKG